MNITKLGHACLLVEENNSRILIDPGKWSEGHTEVENVNAIFITHEHTDHCDVESLRKILTKNPNAVIYANSGAGTQLKAANISFEVFEDGDKQDIQGMQIEAFGREHAIIYKSSPCQNTALLINDALYHPGDSWYIPPKPVKILALPVCAPWMKISEGIDFALHIKPDRSFPIHDGMLKYFSFHKHPGMYLPEAGVDWFVPENGVSFPV